MPVPTPFGERRQRGERVGVLRVGLEQRQSLNDSGVHRGGVLDKARQCRSSEFLVQCQGLLNSSGCQLSAFSFQLSAFEVGADSWKPGTPGTRPEKVVSSLAS